MNMDFADHMHDNRYADATYRKRRINPHDSVYFTRTRAYDRLSRTGDVPAGGGTVALGVAGGVNWTMQIYRFRGF